MLHKTCPKCGYLSHCTKSVCDVCQYVFSNKQSKKKNSRSNESSEMCELCKASDKERKARKRASENDDEGFARRAIDRKRRKCFSEVIDGCLLMAIYLRILTYTQCVVEYET